MCDLKLHFCNAFSEYTFLPWPLNMHWSMKIGTECVFRFQVSISPIFYEQLFHTKVFCRAFMCLQFGFVIFWRKDFVAKAAHTMLVKSTPGQTNGLHKLTQKCTSKTYVSTNLKLTALKNHSSSKCLSRFKLDEVI